MDVVAQTCDFVTGRSEADGGAGDSSVLTALGVFQGMRAAAAHRWGEPTLAGRRVGIAGSARSATCSPGCWCRTARTWSSRTSPTAALDRVRGEHPEVQVAGSTAELVVADLDVYAPCALGGALTAGRRGRAAARRSSAARRTTSSPSRRWPTSCWPAGITYAPDYLVNSGGVIQVADELHGFSFDRARERTLGIFDATAAVLREADAEQVRPVGRRGPAGRAPDRRRCAERAALPAWAPMSAPGPGRWNPRGRCTVDPTTRSHDSGAASRRPGRRMRGSTLWVAAAPRPSRPRSPGS